MGAVVVPVGPVAVSLVVIDGMVGSVGMVGMGVVVPLVMPAIVALMCEGHVLGGGTAGRGAKGGRQRIAPTQDEEGEHKGGQPLAEAATPEDTTPEVASAPGVTPTHADPGPVRQRSRGGRVGTDGRGRARGRHKWLEPARPQGFPWTCPSSGDT